MHERPQEGPDIDEFLRTSIPSHAAAIEEYRFFVQARKRGVYQKTWEAYRDVVTGGRFVEEFLGNQDPLSAIEERIFAILQFANS